MTRGEAIALAIFLALAALLVTGAVNLRGSCHVDCVYLVQVSGRVVEKEKGDPTASALVLCFPVRNWAEDEALVDGYRETILQRLAAVRDGATERLQRLGTTDIVSGDHTDGAGAFSTLVDVPWSYDEIGGSPSGPTRPPPRLGVAILRIEIPGREPVLCPVPAGTWTEHDGEDGLWFAWDLGVVEVPGRP